jgi:Zn-dependent protease with chaperone function
MKKPPEGVLLHERGHHRRRQSLKMLIGLEGAHGFCVSIFGGVEHLELYSGTLGEAGTKMKVRAYNYIS